MERYPSQFDAAWRNAVAHVPETDRNLFLAPAASVLQRAVAACP